MTIARDDPTPPDRPKGRPGPKPRGRTVVPLTITVTHAQRDALETLADTERSSISAVIRRFIAVGLTASALYIITALIEITIARHTGTEEEQAPTRTPSRSRAKAWQASLLRRARSADLARTHASM